MKFTPSFEELERRDVPSSFSYYVANAPPTMSLADYTLDTQVAFARIIANHPGLSVNQVNDPSKANIIVDAKLLPPSQHATETILPGGQKEISLNTYYHWYPNLKNDQMALTAVQGLQPWLAVATGIINIRVVQSRGG